MALVMFTIQSLTAYFWFYEPLALRLPICSRLCLPTNCQAAAPRGCLYHFPPGHLVAIVRPLSDDCSRTPPAGCRHPPGGCPLSFKGAIPLLL